MYAKFSNASGLRVFPYGKRNWQQRRLFSLGRYTTGSPGQSIQGYTTGRVLGRVFKATPQAECWAEYSRLHHRQSAGQSIQGYTTGRVLGRVFKATPQAECWAEYSRLHHKQSAGQSIQGYTTSRVLGRVFKATPQAECWAEYSRLHHKQSAGQSIQGYTTGRVLDRVFKATPQAECWVYFILCTDAAHTQATPLLFSRCGDQVNILRTYQKKPDKGSLLFKGTAGKPYRSLLIFL